MAMVLEDGTIEVKLDTVGSLVSFRLCKLVLVIYLNSVKSTCSLILLFIDASRPVYG